MIIASMPSNEVERLTSLKSYDILDSLPEKDYDNITQLASEICETPVSLISLIDDKRQWFKSAHGTDIKETPKEFSFCAHGILNPNEIFIIPDSRKDERFAGNPMVTGSPPVIFYAGVPLINKDGFPLGSLCVIDNDTKKLSEHQLNALKGLAKQVVTLLELRKANKTSHTLINFLQARNKELEEKADVMEQIQPEIASLHSIIEILQTKHANDGNDKNQDLLKDAFQSIKKIKAAFNTSDETT